jgi:hypothetical protein
MIADTPIRIPLVDDQPAYLAKPGGFEALEQAFAAAAEARR